MIRVGAVVENIVSSSNVECAFTLGSVVLSVVVALGEVVGNFDGVSTLGNGVGKFGSFFALFSASSIFVMHCVLGLLLLDLVLLLKLVMQGW